MRLPGNLAGLTKSRGAASVAGTVGRDTASDVVESSGNHSVCGRCFHSADSSPCCASQSVQKAAAAGQQTSLNIVRLLGGLIDASTFASNTSASSVQAGDR